MTEPLLSKPATARFARPGLLAIEPKAFGLEFVLPCAAVAREPFALVADGRAAVVEVSGPLCYDGFLFDSYRAIEARCDAALASDATVLVLKLATPGGEVYGAFDTARAIAAKAKAAGKRVIAFSEAQCCSAGYALACGADEIWVSEVATIGSIGVVAVALETTVADRAMGMRFELITSGARKGDGNPHVQLSDEARAAQQKGVDDTAAVFFALVKEARGLDAAPLEAATFIGAAARAAGLCDRVGSWRDLLNALSAGEAAGATRSSEAAKAGDSQAMAFPDKDEKEKDAKAAAAPSARDALAAAAEAGDAKAKKALAAYDESDDKDAASDEPDKKDEPSKDAKSAADEKPAPKDDDKEAASSAAALAALAGTVNKLSAQAEARAAAEDAAARSAVFAARPDLSKALIESFKAIPTAALAATVAAVPVAQNPLVPPKGDPAMRGSTGAAGSLADAAAMPPAMAAAMGLSAAVKYGVKDVGSLQIFGVPIE